MWDEGTDKTTYQEYVECPKCGAPLKLDINLTHMNGELYMWFEGLCLDCFDTVMDPMPVLTDITEENRRMIWRMLSN